MLERHQKDGETRALSCLGELLKQVGVPVATVGDRFEVLSEFVDHQEEGPVASQALCNLYQGRRRGAGPTGILAGGVAECRLECSGSWEAAEGWDSAVFRQYGTMKAPEDGAIQWFTRCGYETPMESGCLRSVIVVSRPCQVRHVGVCRLHQPNGRIARGPIRPQVAHPTEGPATTCPSRRGR